MCKSEFNQRKQFGHSLVHSLQFSSFTRSVHFDLVPLGQDTKKFATFCFLSKEVIGTFD